MTDWLQGRNAPDADNLRQIARRTGASVDWLLGMEGARKYKDESREPATLVADVAAHVRRHVLGFSRTAPWKPYVDSVPLDGAALLVSVVERTIDRIEQAWEAAAASTVTASESLNSALDSLHLVESGVTHHKLRVMKDRDRDLSPIRKGEGEKKKALQAWLVGLKEAEFRRRLLASELSSK